MNSIRVWGDWGTTRLRLWRVEQGVPMAKLEGPGIGQLAGTPGEALRTALAPWLAEGALGPVTLCGMAGSRSGLAEAPYASCPADVGRWRNDMLQATWQGGPLRIAAGLACRDSGDRPDVMRGEETQIFGALRARADLAAGRQTLVLPGTHSKWVLVQDGRIERFRTFLTGEMFGLLRRSTLLAGSGPERTDDSAFAQGLARSGDEAGVLGALFEARAAQMRDGRDGAWAAGFVSGLLIGAEIRGARAAGFATEDVTLIGDPSLVDRYCTALATFGVASTSLDGDMCVLSGLEQLDADN
ncbi:MAG: 2-dehydro-3-deoxygalactonokinase [Novosphingobium sp.]